MGSGRLSGQHPRSLDMLLRRVTQLARALTMRVYEAKIQYLLVQEGPQEVLNRADKIVEYMNGAFDEAPVAEMFYVVCLTRKNRPLGRHRVTVGTATSALAHPREVFRAAILASAAAIVCVHNHPSGDPGPSAADLTITKLLREASKTVEIDLLDHVIIGTKDDDPLGRGYYSFRDAGLL
ncbi:MAG TPA: JAB domain-containing protein [Fimbriimonas sp.]|nr:JAB domain-containing protein [Fimbriimonas sp.]